jgi:membrane-bound lytic murein transglycosylase B
VRVRRLRVIAAAMVIAIPCTASPAAPVGEQLAKRQAAPTTRPTGGSDRGAESRLRDPPARAVARPAVTPGVAAGGTASSTATIVSSLGDSGIPEVALRAYRSAELALAAGDPSCGMTWSLLAAIGRVESNHGRFGGVRLREDGYGTGQIRGIPLDGRPGVALILDSDGGALDGDREYDRAVGPMQFIPSTWRSVAADGNGDGRSDPDNLFDAALGAAAHLCAGPADLRDPTQRAAAVWRYNNSDEYVRVVLALAAAYEQARPAPLPEPGPAPSPPPAIETPELPPASIGWPPGLAGPASVAEPPEPTTPAAPSCPQPADTGIAPDESASTTMSPGSTTTTATPAGSTTATTGSATTTTATATTAVTTAPVTDARCPTSTTSTTTTETTPPEPATTETTAQEPATTETTAPAG